MQHYQNGAAVQEFEGREIMCVSVAICSCGGSCRSRPAVASVYSSDVSSAAGSLTVKVAPRPSPALCAVTVPSCASTT